MFATGPSLARGASVTLAWDANTEPDLAGYFRYYGSSSGNYTSRVDVGRVTTNTVSGLAIGATYFFAVTAYNTAGLESEPSNEISYTVPGTNSLPAISSIADQFAVRNTSTPAIPFVVTDRETPAANLVLSATSLNTNLVSAGNVSFGGTGSNRTVTVTPRTNQIGSALIVVKVTDGGGASATETFTLTVAAYNRPPVLNPLSNLAINEDAASQTVNLSGIGSGATNETQTLTVTAISSNPSLIPNPTVNYSSPNSTGTLIFRPLTNAFGAAVVTVTVDDGAVHSNRVSQSFTVTVNAVNDPPTLNALANLTIAANAGTQTVNLSGISSGAANETQSLSVSAASGNAVLIPNPAINYISPNSNGTLTFRPATNATGTAVITVTVNDGQSLSNLFSRAFTVTVVETNAPPSISLLSSATIFANAAAALRPFTVSDAETPAANLTLSASSSDSLLLPATNILFGGSGSNRTVRLIPAPDRTGTATVTITVSDGARTNASTFNLTVINPPGQMVYLTCQAEKGSVVAPMAIFNEPPPAGALYVATTNREQGTVSLPVDLPVAGTYVIWARVLAIDPSRDSFYVSIDGGAEDVYDCAEGTWSGGWQWTRVAGRAGGSAPFPAVDPRTFALSAGAHTIRFRGREANTRLDQILVSNDLGFVPGTSVDASITLVGDQLAIGWASVSGAVYRVRYKSHLNQSNWMDLSHDILATNPVSRWTDGPARNGPSRFYGVRLLR